MFLGLLMVIHFKVIKDVDKLYRLKNAVLSVCLLVVILLTVGCAAVTEYLFSEKEVDPPAELVPFTPTLSMQTRWRVKHGVGRDGQEVNLVPAVIDDTIIIVDREGKVGAYSRIDGSALWQVETKTLVSGGPGIGEGYVFFGTSDGEILALQLADGALKWRVSISSEVLALPRVTNGMVIVRSSDGKVIALDIENGERRWMYEREVPILTLRGTGSPVLVDDTVICGFANGKVASLGMVDGNLLWETNVTTSSGRSELERLVDIDADPVVVDGIVYVAAFQGSVAAIEIETGTIFWSREISSFAGLGGDAEHLYVSDDLSHIWALDPSNGASFWKQETLHRRNVTAASVMGETIVVGDYQGYLHWLSVDDGRFVARQLIDDGGVSHAPVVVGDILYVYGNNGELQAIQQVSN